MTQPQQPVPTTSPRVLSRRALGRAAVWSTPVIAGVVLAPNAHAQTSSALTVTITQATVCLAPGRGAVRFTVTVVGTLPVGSSFRLSKFVAQSTNPSSFSPTELDVPATFTKTPATGTNQQLVTISNTVPVVGGSFVVDVRDVAFSTGNRTYFVLRSPGTGPVVASAQSGTFREGELDAACAAP